MANVLSGTPIQSNNAVASADELRLQRMLEMSRDADVSAPVQPNVPTSLRATWQARWRKIPRRTWLMSAGVVALIALALLIGWLLGSVNQPTRAAWQSSPQYEKMYLTLVADKYARTGDALQAQRDLAGARPEDVALVLETMQRETTDATRRQRLAALANVVRPTVSQTSYVPLLLSQPAFVFSLLLSFTPMLAALALLLVPYLRARLRTADTPEEQDHIAEVPSVGSELEAVAEADVNTPAVGAPTPDQAAVAAPPEEEKKKEEEEEEEEQSEDSSGLGDLASLFEEEDTSLAALENFCKGLPEINVDVLVAKAKETAQALREAIARRA